MQAFRPCGYVVINRALVFADGGAGDGHRKSYSAVNAVAASALVEQAVASAICVNGDAIDMMP